MTFTILDLKIPKSNCKSTIVKCRNYNKFDEYLFQQDILNSFVFNTLYNIVDLNEAWSAWHAEFLRICEKHAPKRSFKFKQRYNPWFPEHITKSIYHRDFLYEKAVVSKSPTSMNAYILARNKVNLAIRKAKKDYYHNIITTNIRHMWSLLKTILPSKINTSRKPTNLTADMFNKYLSTIGRELTKHFITADNASPINDKTSSCSKSFNFRLIPVTFTLKKLSSLKLSSSPDILGLENKLLRLCAPYIATSLTHIYNLFLYHGTFPDAFKLAPVTPVYKATGDKSNFSNYRPISVISTVAKILESGVKEQLMTFLCTITYLHLNSLHMLKVAPHRWRCTKMTENWLNAINNKLITAACFID